MIYDVSGKALVAWWVQSMTSASNAWVAERLAMGHPTSVSRAAGRVPNEEAMERQGDELKQTIPIMLKITD